VLHWIGNLKTRKRILRKTAARINKRPLDKIWSFHMKKQALFEITYCNMKCSIFRLCSLGNRRNSRCGAGHWHHGGCQHKFCRAAATRAIRLFESELSPTKRLHRMKVPKFLPPTGQRANAPLELFYESTSFCPSYDLPWGSFSWRLHCSGARVRLRIVPPRVPVTWHVMKMQLAFQGMPTFPSILDQTANPWICTSRYVMWERILMYSCRDECLVLTYKFHSI
jgi:hypothetical protein